MSTITFRLVDKNGKEVRHKVPPIVHMDSALPEELELDGRRFIYVGLSDGYAAYKESQ